MKQPNRKLQTAVDYLHAHPERMAWTGRKLEKTVRTGDYERISYYTWNEAKRILRTVPRTEPTITITKTEVIYEDASGRVVRPFSKLKRVNRELALVFYQRRGWQIVSNRKGAVELIRKHEAVLALPEAA